MAMTDYLNAVADAFQITLRKDAAGKLSGSISHPLKTIVPGQVMYLRVQVVDSLLYDAIGTTGVANVLFHIGSGNLYCYALCEHKGNNITKLFFLDGDKLGFTPTGSGAVSFFPAFWSRRKIFELMVDGLVGCYWKLGSEQTWTAAPDVKTRIRTYLQELKDGKTYAEAATIVEKTHGGDGPEQEAPEPDEGASKKGSATAQKLSAMNDEEYAAYLKGEDVIDIDVGAVAAGVAAAANTSMVDCGSDECSWVEDVDEFWCVSCGLTSEDVPALEGLSIDEIRDAISLPG